MQLTQEQLKKFISGAIRIEETERGLLLFRMTDAQKTAFAPFGAMKCDATAGMKLELLTDAESLTLSYCDARPASSRSKCLFDVTEDGVLVATVGEDPIEAGEGCITVPLSAGYKRVTVYFPNLATFTLKEILLPDGSRADAPRYERNILCLGDSITHGYDAGHPSLAYPNQLGERFRARVWNCGIGGARFSADTLDDTVPFKPDFITVAYGTNDWSHLSAEELAENAHAYFSKLCWMYPKTRIFAILPIWRKDEGRETACGTFDRCYEILGKICRISKWITPVNGKKLTPHLPDFYTDGLHPNDAGFLLYGKNLGDEIARTLSLQKK